MKKNIHDDEYISNDFNYTESSCSYEQETIFNRRIWGIEEVCSFTTYAKGTIYNLVSRGEIPYRKRGGGRRLVFVPSEIIEWFKGEL
jgi:predicted DNA-binding transcriptional regulator AlpA